MIREKIKTRLLKIREKQLLGRHGEFWPNMLNFWVMVLAAMTTVVLVVFANTYLRSYPVYASFENIECSDATHQPLSRGRYGSVQSFILSNGEEIKFRGSLGAGEAGRLYTDRKFNRSNMYHICYILLQGYDFGSDNQIVMLWEHNSIERGELDRNYVENNIVKFNESVMDGRAMLVLDLFILFGMVFYILVGFLYLSFGVFVYSGEKSRG